MQFDLIITNGTVYDGENSAPQSTDIGICGDQIITIGNLAEASAKNTIDAHGCIVCPGFIDAHTHSDAYLLIEPTAASKLYQGVTTEICGNCGASAAPLLGSYKMPSDWLAQLEGAWGEERGAGSWGQGAGGRNEATPSPTPQAPCSTPQVPCSTPQAPCSTPHAPRPWHTVAEYRERFEEAQPAVNAALLIGHNTLHAGVCGYEPRGATADELKQMIRQLEQALDEGAIGLSSGLAYEPGVNTPKEELIALARVAKRYTTHMRSEGSHLLEAIDEAIDIAERAGATLQISHLKTSGASSWHKLPAALEKIHAAAERFPLGSDRYPYLAGCTDLDIVLPTWASHGGRDAVIARLRDPATRQKIGDDLRKNPPGHWNNVMIGSTSFEALKGAMLPAAAEALGLDEVDALLHMIDVDELKTGGIFFGMNEENMWTILAEPYVSLGSDASLRAPWGPLSTDHPHPRAYGAFTRFLRAALDGQTVPLAEAIRKMTALPAEQFGLKKRGKLKPGYFADIVIFDPPALAEHTTYKEPHQLSDGMQHIIVNGVLSLTNGRHTAQRAGAFLG